MSFKIEILLQDLFLWDAFPVKRSELNETFLTYLLHCYYTAVIKGNVTIYLSKIIIVPVSKIPTSGYSYVCTDGFFAQKNGFTKLFPTL